VTQNLDDGIDVDAAEASRIPPYFGYASPEQSSSMLILSLVIQPLQDLSLVCMRFKGDPEAPRTYFEIFEQCVD
jgi:hypothetical protein